MHSEVLDKKNQEIFAELKVFSEFYLAGGTALALQIGHRKSVDFDFFSEKEIPKNLYDKVKKIFKGRTINSSVNNPDELSVFVDNVKTTFLKYPFAIISDLVDYEGVRLLNISEIAASKAYTIGRRGSLKDYIDLYFIISERHSSVNNIIEIAEKKYGDEFNARLFLEQLVYLEDIEDERIVFIKNEIDRNEMNIFFETEIKKINI
jgi:hypothetical protein